MAGGILIITCSGNEIEQARPTKCKCKKSRFHRHGSYMRVIAGEQAFCFICRSCKTFVTIIPSSCVPYKHHPVSTIEPVLDGRLLEDKSGPQLEREHWLYRSTVYRWVNEFSSHLGVLATEGSARLGITPLAGSLRQIYQGLKQHYSSFSGFLNPLQVDLCRNFPPLGIFRPLIS